MERAFTPDGKMKNTVPPDVKRQIKGALPFYSVDTREEANALIEAAIEAGEFYRRADGTVWETTLAWEQTPDNLRQAGENLAAIHADLESRHE